MLLKKHSEIYDLWTKVVEETLEALKVDTIYHDMTNPELLLIQDQRCPTLKLDKISLVIYSNFIFNIGIEIDLSALVSALRMNLRCYGRKQYLPSNV